MILGTVMAKVVPGIAQLSSQNTEQYIAKFSFSPNLAGHMRGVFEVLPGASPGETYFDRHPHNLQLLLYTDTMWEKVKLMYIQGSLCQDRTRLASVKRQFRQPKTGRLIEFDAKLAGTQSKVTRYWYAVLSDCNLEEYDAHPPALKYELTFMNGESHLPADEVGVPTFLLLTLVVLMLFASVLTWQLMQHAKAGQVHLVLIALAVAYCLQTLSVLLELLHLWQFSRDGKGLRWRHTFFAADFLAEACQGDSELVVSLLLIFLSFGWTLFNASAHTDGIQKAFQSISTTGVCVAVLVIVLQIGLEIASRRYEDDFNQFHDHEHLPGYLFLLMRVCLGFLFIGGCTKSLRRAESAAKLKLIKYLRALGGLWFMSFPLLVMLSAWMEPFKRHSVVVCGSIILQVAAMIGLILLFREGGQYHKMSSLAQIGASLPSVALPGMPGRSKVNYD